MRISATRRSYVLAFELTLADAKNLIDRMKALFGDAEVGVSIEVSLKRKELEFDSLDELISSNDMAQRVTSFSATVRDRSSRRSRWLSVGAVDSPFLGSASVAASGEDEAWCRGAADSIAEFLRAHRKWYGLIRSSLFGAVVIWWLMSAVVTSIMSADRTPPPVTVLIAWLGIGLLLLLLLFTRDVIFPSKTLVVRAEENWLRRHSAELIVVFTAITAIAAVIAALR